MNGFIQMNYTDKGPTKFDVKTIPKYPTITINYANVTNDKLLEYSNMLKEKYDFNFVTLAIPHDMAKEGETYRNSKGEILGFTKEKVSSWTRKNCRMKLVLLWSD